MYALNQEFTEFVYLRRHNPKIISIFDHRYESYSWFLETFEQEKGASYTKKQNMLGSSYKDC